MSRAIRLEESCFPRTVKSKAQVEKDVFISSPPISSESDEESLGSTILDNLSTQPPQKSSVRPWKDKGLLMLPVPKFGASI